MKISAVIIAFNEEAKIADAIRSLSWADEVLLVDSASTDRTREIAEALGARVVTQPWLGFSKQKQFAVDSAENDWVFSLDADERVSNELRSEIMALRSVSDPLDGYDIPRLSFYMGQVIRHSGWYPNRQLRLFDRKKGRWNERIVHESVEMDKNSQVGTLKGNILHFSIDSAQQHHEMIGSRYAPLAARQMFETGKRTSKPRVVVAGFLAFIRSYFLQAGFLDGFPGFCVARFAAHHAYLKHLILLEIQKAAGNDDSLDANRQP